MRRIGSAPSYNLKLELCNFILVIFVILILVGPSSVRTVNFTLSIGKVHGQENSSEVKSIIASIFSSINDTGLSNYNNTPPLGPDSTLDENNTGDQSLSPTSLLPQQSIERINEGQCLTSQGDNNPNMNHTLQNSSFSSSSLEEQHEQQAIPTSLVITELQPISFSSIQQQKQEQEQLLPLLPEAQIEICDNFVDDDNDGFVDFDDPEGCVPATVPEGNVPVQSLPFENVTTSDNFTQPEQLQPLPQQQTLVDEFGNIIPIQPPADNFTQPEQLQPLPQQQPLIDEFGNIIPTQPPADNFTQPLQQPDPSSMVVNTPPSPSDQNVTTIKNIPQCIILSGNDPDPNTYLTVSIISPPASGTLSEIDQSTGTVFYTPYPNITGLDSFTFALNDGLTYSNNVGVINITIMDGISQEQLSEPQGSSQQISSSQTSLPHDNFTSGAAGVLSNRTIMNINKTIPMIEDRIYIHGFGGGGPWSLGK